MKTSSSSFGLICLTLVLTGVVSWVLYFRQAKQEDTVDINQFPKTIGTWSSEDLPITKDEFAILETENAFVRKYTDQVSKNEAYLYIVYSQNNRKVAHPPEVCYIGSGITILQNASDPIKVQYKNLTIGANRLRLNKGKFDQFAFYWFKVGDQFTPNYFKQQALIGLNTLIGRKTGSALVRVSADVVGGDTESAIKNIKNFTSLIAPDLFQYLP